MDEWKEKLTRNETAWEEERGKMDEREKMYRGEYTFEDLTTRTDAHSGQTVKYVYNALAENIEAQVSNDIPAPKVTARREQDEHLAVIIENMIRNELDRMPFERINDLSERVVPIQGAGLYMIEWDNTKRTHNTVGEVAAEFVHPKRLIPQDGVYDGIGGMDYFILKTPQTKETIKARYGVDVADEAESEPEVKGIGDAKAAEDMVTQYTAYYRNESGGIGKYSWVNDTELEDLEDYQARRLTKCAHCGAVEPLPGEVITDGTDEPVVWESGGACPVCGAHEWKEQEEDYEEIDPWSILRSDGLTLAEALPAPEEAGYEPSGETIPSHNAGGEGASSGETIPPHNADGVGTSFGGTVTPSDDEDGTSFDDAGISAGAGEKWTIPYYKPNVFPLVLQQNVSVYGRLMGESDVDKQASLQKGLNTMEQKLFDRFLKAGTKITLPDDTNIRIDPNDDTVWRVGNLQDLSVIRSFNFVGDVSQEMAQVQAIYQQMRQTTGVTDSFQGRKDTTATSGTAKQFAAAQTAGRLESKRVQKEAAYAELFELIFKFRLAYADEPRPVVYQDGEGNTVYDTFSKWDFLERDEAGDFWWNDAFLFACDPTVPLASNRQQLWQETTAFFQSGAFGDPTQLESLVEYWRKMETLHYPGAGETRKNLQERLERQAAQAQAMPMQGMGGPEMGVPGMGGPAEEPAPVSEEEIEEMARQAAMADMGM